MQFDMQIASRIAPKLSQFRYRRNVQLILAFHFYKVCGYRTQRQINLLQVFC